MDHLVLEHRSRDWHIGRIIYFINHPEEIRDIEIDNECIDNYILPQAVIVDGWHRFNFYLSKNYNTIPVIGF